MANVDWAYAINNRRLVSFVYEGLERVVIPAAYGVNNQTRNRLVRAYQVAGRDATRSIPAWSLFREELMVNGAILDETFDEAPPKYKRGDRAMDVIYAQL